MNDPKQQRTAKPASLLSQWWTLGAIATDSRTVGRHVAVAWVIIDRFMQKRGNGRASIRYLERATGLSQHTIIKACRELVQWGYFTAQISPGRATEYTPKWSVLHPSTALTGAEPLYSASADLMCSTSAKSAVPMFSESYLPSPAYRQADGISTNEVSASGPDAEAPAVAGGFERVWRAYARFGNKAASRLAFAAIINPDVDHIEARASAWAASAKPGQRRMPLERWLAAEKYDEADRSTRPRARPPEEHELSRRRTDADTAVEVAEYDREIRGAAIEISVPRNVPLTVTSTCVEVREGDKWMVLVTDGGRVAVIFESDRADLQEAGQAHFGRLTNACGVSEIDTGEELHGCAFAIVGGTFKQVAAMAA